MLILLIIQRNKATIKAIYNSKFCCLNIVIYWSTKVMHCRYKLQNKMMAGFVNVTENIFIKKLWLQFVISVFTLEVPRIRNCDMHIIFQIIFTKVIYIALVFKIIRQTQNNIIFNKVYNKLFFSTFYFFIIDNYILI